MEKSEFSRLSDSELYKKCQEYGFNARQWIRRFEGLLSEVFRRRLYRRRGYASIHEFGAKLAGMSHEKVDRILNLARNLENKPILRAMLEQGEVGYSKLETVASIATVEDEEVWAEKIENLSRPALQMYVKEMRSQINVIEENDNRFKFIACDENQPEKTSNQVDDSENLTLNPAVSQDPEQEPWTTMFFKLKPEIEAKLRLMKVQLEEESGETLSFGQVLEKIMGRLEKLEQQKSENRFRPKAHKIVKLCPECTQGKHEKSAPSRHIPNEVKTVVLARSENLCVYPQCNKPAKILHHTRRYALNSSHDPQSIQPLCIAHERIAHAGLIKNEIESPQNWQLKTKADESTREFQIDKKVMSFRKEFSFSSARITS